MARKIEVHDAIAPPLAVAEARRLSSIVGHESVVRALRKAAASDQVLGAYLFVGPNGVGKTVLAQAFATALACNDPRASPFDACGTCGSCRRTAAGTQPELVTIAPAGESTVIWQFWDRQGKPPGALQHSLNFAPAIGRRRVFIIERAETLTASAANSLLKTLEEPPPYVTFVLLAQEAAQIPPTIRSRTQQLRLHGVPRAELIQFLVASYGITPGLASLFSAQAEGMPGVAVRLASAPGAREELDMVLDTVELLPTVQPLAVLQCAERLRKMASGLKWLAPETGAPESSEGDAAPRERAGKRQMRAVLEVMCGFYRDLLAIRLIGAAAPITYEQRRTTWSPIAEVTDPADLIAALRILAEGVRRLDFNVGANLLMDGLVMQLTASAR